MASPLALAALVIGRECVQANGTNPTPDLLRYIGWACVVWALLTPLYLIVFRPVNQTITDAGRIVKRGVLTPEQVRQEFIVTMGREPTIAEVHDLYEMIKSEYNQAFLTLAESLLLGTSSTVGSRERFCSNDDCHRSHQPGRAIP